MSSPQGVEIGRFDRDNPIPGTIADQLGDLFRAQYPAFAPDHVRRREIREHSGRVAVQALLDGGRTLYIASKTQEDVPVVGLLESATQQLRDGVYEQLVWLMTDPIVRGQGVAHQLHERFIGDATKRAVDRLPKPSVTLLTVYEQNPAVGIYEHWGYSQTGTVPGAEGKIFMSQPLPVKWQ